MDLRHLRHRLMRLVACVAVGGGCSGDGGTASSGGGSGTGGLVDGAFQAECDMLFTCGCEYVGYADAAACVKAIEVEWAGIRGVAAKAGLTADLACFQSTRPFAAYGCQSATEVVEGADPTRCERCQHAYCTKTVGERCTSFGERMSECAQGLVCAPGPDPVCIDPCAIAGEGEPCYFLPCAEGEPCSYVPVHPCADGLQGWGGVCLAPGVGDHCEAWLKCAEGLACFGDTCTIPPGLGEPCLASEGFYYCGEGTCDLEAMVCVTPAGLGEDCTDIDCGADYLCDSVTNLCAAPPSDGQPCLNETYCAEGLVCDSKAQLCVVPPGDGQPCLGDHGSHYCALPYRCDLNTHLCVPLPGDGEPCLDEPDRCGEGLLCDERSGLCEREPPLVCVEP